MGKKTNNTIENKKKRGEGRRGEVGEGGKRGGYA